MLCIYMFRKHVFFKSIAITNNEHQNKPLYPNITSIKYMDCIPHHYFLLITMPQSAHHVMLNFQWLFAVDISRAHIPHKQQLSWRR